MPKYGIYLTPSEWRDVLVKLTSRSSWPFDHPVVGEISNVVNVAKKGGDLEGRPWK